MISKRQMQVAGCSHWECMARLQTSFWQKIGDESQAVVVRMQELRRIYRSEIITRCTNCAGCIRDASQVVFKMHKLWGRGDGSQMHHKTWMRLRGTLSGHTWWQVAHQTMNWNKKVKPTFCLTFLGRFLCLYDFPPLIVNWCLLKRPWWCFSLA